VPNVERNESHRLVLDESSMDFRGLSDDQIERHLDDLNDSLRGLRSRDDHEVACPPMWEGVKCLDECELYQFLCREHASGVDRDTLLLAFSLLSNSPEWQTDEGLEPSVAIADADSSMALSVAYAHQHALARRGVACLVFGASVRRGFMPVRGAGGEATVFFFADPAALTDYWRHLFALEDIVEREFFSFCGFAFPSLVLHPGLSFDGFEGAYRDLRDRVVAVLAALGDHFGTEYQRCHGLPHEIQAAMGSHHVDLSPESPNTRGSERLMRQRRRDFEGQTFTCEWHAKLEPHRNRIHFAVPTSDTGGKIFIGIFVKHLDT
jgi:hypothetical protein